MLAAGYKPNTELADKLRGKAGELHLAGDCIEARRIMDAIAEGYRAGLAI